MTTVDINNVTAVATRIDRTLYYELTAAFKALHDAVAVARVHLGDTHPEYVKAKQRFDDLKERHGDTLTWKYVDFVWWLTDDPSLTI